MAAPRGRKAAGAKAPAKAAGVKAVCVMAVAYRGNVYAPGDSVVLPRADYNALVKAGVVKASKK